MSLLIPKNLRRRKPQTRTLNGKASNGNTVAFGEFGLKAMDNRYVTNRQLESARKVIVRSVKKFGKIWFRVFPAFPLTKKGLEMPMGKGKGEVDQYTAPIKKGKVVFEINGLPEAEAREVLMKAAAKMPMKMRVVAKGEVR